MNIKYNEDGTVNFLEREHRQEDPYDFGDGFPELFSDYDVVCCNTESPSQAAWDLLIDTILALPVSDQDIETLEAIDHLTDITGNYDSAASTIAAMWFKIVMEADVDAMTDDQFDDWKNELMDMLATNRSVEQNELQEPQLEDEEDDAEQAYRRAMSIIR